MTGFRIARKVSKKIENAVHVVAGMHRLSEIDLYAIHFVRPRQHAPIFGDVPRKAATNGKPPTKKPDDSSAHDWS